MAGAILDDHAEAAGAGDAAHRRRQHDEQQAVLDLGQPFGEFGLNAPRRLGRILGALLERLERDEDRARIGRVGEGGAGEADHVHAVRHARHLQRNIERALLHRVGA